MRICVFGLWHLGSVTAACLSSLGFDVVGLDTDKSNVDALNSGKAQIHEPGLDALLEAGLKTKSLSFTTVKKDALSNADVLWVTFDTPVDENDEADIVYVENNIKMALTYLKPNAKVILSSQLPVGFTRKLINQVKDKKLYFAYSPENLRLGKAINVFKEPDRIIIGTEKGEDLVFKDIFSKITDKMEFMSIESAEMTKHAINAFLATSVVFANELAVLCESAGADAKEVERGLKTEERIGPKAYLKAGNAFAGGTLARDIAFLMAKSEEFKKETFIFKAVKQSNDFHKTWIRRKLVEVYGTISALKVSILGLTYKPGTDTLRRSSSVELCRWLFENGAVVHAYDPAVNELRDDLSKVITLEKSFNDAILSSDCIVIGTEHPIFKDINNEMKDIVSGKTIVDISGFLEKSFRGVRNVRYISVGRPQI